MSKEFRNLYCKLGMRLQRNKEARPKDKIEEMMALYMLHQKELKEERLLIEELLNKSN